MGNCEIDNVYCIFNDLGAGLAMAGGCILLALVVAILITTLSD